MTNVRISRGRSPRIRAKAATLHNFWCRRPRRQVNLLRGYCSRPHWYKGAAYITRPPRLQSPMGRQRPREAQWHRWRFRSRSSAAQVGRSDVCKDVPDLPNRRVRHAMSVINTRGPPRPLPVETVPSTVCGYKFPASTAVSAQLSIPNLESRFRHRLAKVPRRPSATTDGFKITLEP